MTLRKCNPVWVCSQVTFAKWMHLCNQHWGWERARLSPKTTRGSPATFSYSSRIWWLSLPVPAFSRMSCKWGQSVWTRWSGFFYAASRVWAPSRLQWGFPGGSDGKSVCLQCGRPRFNPWVGKIPWGRKWQPTLVLSPEEFHGQRSLVGYSPWGRKESDTTEWLYILGYSTYQQ